MSISAQGAAAGQDPSEELPESSAGRGRGLVRPSSTRVQELGFVRKPMVRWLDPRQLLDTSMRVVLAGIFGAYSDKREIQALMSNEVYDKSNSTNLWLDYVADLGDGWNPTYSIATLLASEKLELERNGDTYLTERGRILVMGGDQVYPVPKRADYENRMLGPYRSAFPVPPEHPPELFAIPGSHDWFDGLVNFMSVFCRGYWIGGWKTRQSRSHFAVKLPHHWWLWGVDIQFGDYIDEAQLRYFSELASTQLEPDDRIILCTAKAIGASTRGHLYAERNLDYFEREIVDPSGARVALQLASGRHHYARYRRTDGARQHIGAGGGGAFLHPTHHLPERIETAREGRVYERQTTYPSIKTSKRLRKRLWLLPVRNFAFAGFLGAVNVVLALMLGLHLDDRHESLGVGDLWRALWTSPTAVLTILFILGLLGGMVRFAHDAPGRVTRFLLGIVHSGLQLATVAGMMMVASRMTTGSGLRGLESVVAFLGVLGVLGGFGGALGMAAYLWATNGLGFHANEAYAPLRVMDYKHFLRLHIDDGGGLTVFPVGVHRVGRRWRLRRDGPRDASWFIPADGDVEPHLIEGPIRVA